MNDGGWLCSGPGKPGLHTHFLGEICDGWHDHRSFTLAEYLGVDVRPDLRLGYRWPFIFAECEVALSQHGEFVNVGRQPLRLALAAARRWYEGRP